MKDTPVRILIVGCGAVFNELYSKNIDLIQKEGLIEVCAGIDTNYKTLEIFQQKYKKAKTFQNLVDALDQLEFDSALVLSPPSSHYQIIDLLLKKGIHIYCEKPLVVNLDDAISINKLLRSSNCVCKVGYVRRAFPNLRILKDSFKQIKGNKKIKLSDGEVFRWPIKSDLIFNSAIQGSGVVWDKLSHNLDMINWIDPIMEITSINSHCIKGNTPSDVFIEGNTVNAVFEAHISWFEEFPNNIEISSPNQKIVSENSLSQFISAEGIEKHETIKDFYPRSYEEAVLLCLREFLSISSKAKDSFLADFSESIELTRFLDQIDQGCRKVK